MSCKFDKDIIQKYIDNTIDPLELIIFKEHVTVCPDCKFELELMSKIEDSMYQHFNSLPMSEMLDEFSMKTLNKCYSESNSYTYKKGVTKIWEINKMVAKNASRCVGYLPGSKLVAKAAKKASKDINNAAKDYVKTNFKKLIIDAVK